MADLAFLVTVTLNQQEVDKRNRKAKRVGRAETSAQDMVENLISDSVKHSFIVTDTDIRLLSLEAFRRERAALKTEVDRVLGERVHVLNSIGMTELREKIYAEIDRILV